ncbi:MAG: EF-hand domain-containing protein [Isosphaeraceae bacterium]|nr:EF-hand domain-containing protein [Isosphaeraceae bacterium]
MWTTALEMGRAEPSPRRWACAFAILATAVLLGGLPTPGRAADPEPSRPRLELSTAVGRALGRFLERSWPDHPEWLAMLADILQGSQLGPEDGWFRKAKAQTRFGWEATRSRYDRDGDGRIDREEFAGPEPDFARLDRDRDGAITAADFDWSAHALAPSPGMMLFLLADRDANGKLTREEFDALFRVLDRDNLGFLALDDFKALLSPQGQRSSPSGPPSSNRGPSKLTLIKGLLRQEIGALQPGPVLGESAPDFTLRTVDGGRTYTLSRLIGPKPVVLVFGNFTCGPFRSQAGNVEQLYRRYHDRAEFLMIYVREAHPRGGWVLPSNERVGVALDQPRTYDERVVVAQMCQRKLDFDLPFLVDTIDDAVGARYSGMPSRLYLIDRQGKIAYKSGRGPFGFKPGELEQALILLLQEEGTSGSR